MRARDNKTHSWVFWNFFKVTSFVFARESTAFPAARRARPGTETMVLHCCGGLVRLLRRCSISFRLATVHDVQVIAFWIICYLLAVRR